ncbi:MAG TPA: hypothetical protein VG188_07405 [Solirubrobacteraceae bacterium]|jgi:desulfoferrodoxin-like iron-binding protein|nr:hypothetical protein [Solirubrobacteraceae bacterium]
MLKVGKRFECASCGQTVMVAKASADGDLTCCGAKMSEQGPRKLGSSD